MLVFDNAFRFYRIGVAAADAVLLWLPLAVLGIAVTVWLIAARARVSTADSPASPSSAASSAVTGPSPWAGGPQPVDHSKPTGWAAAAWAAAAVVGLLALVGLGPWLLRSLSFSTRLVDDLPVHLANTWQPPQISTLLGVVAPALAGFGIGALRPLGARSELLLLPFAPWLFVGTSVLAPVAWFHRTVDGSGFITLIPPGALSIPVLVGSALVFRGTRWLLALPLVGAAALLTWIAAAQDTLWPLIAGFRPDEAPMQAVVLRGVMAMRFAGEVPLGWLYPLPILLVVAAVVAAVQILVLDRLALRTGRPGAQDPPERGF
jgi:hypothetical protein